MIYVYIDSFFPIDIYRLKYIIKNFQNYKFVTKEENLDIVKRYVKDVKTIDEIEGWILVSYDRVQEIKNNRIEIIAFPIFKLEKLKIKSYLYAIDYLKKNKFENAVFLPDLRKIEYKKGWWYMNYPLLFKYTEDPYEILAHGFRDVHETSIYNMELVNKIEKLLELKYNVYFYPIPQPIIMDVPYFFLVDPIGYHIIKTIVGDYYPFEPVGIFPFKNYTDIVLIDSLNKKLLARIEVPTKDIKRILEELWEETKNIEIVEVNKRLVIFDKRDLEKIEKMKKD